MPDQTPPFGTFKPHGLVAGLVSISRAAPATWTGQRLAFLVRALGIAALRGRPLDVEANGARMRLHPAHNNAEKKLAFTPHYFDAEERSFLEGAMGEDCVFVDVGADVGGYALFAAAHAGPRARILAVEPQPDIFDRLVFNIRENGFSTVKALACAIADVDGDVTLFVNPVNQGESSMRTIDSHRKARQITVHGRSLAGLLAEERMARVDVLKLDVKGAEDLILEPFFRDAPKTLWPRVLIVDQAPARWGLDLKALLTGLGYAAVRRTPSNLIFQRG